MNPAQLSALFAQHKGAALGGAAVVVVGLGLYSRKVKAPAATTAATAGATVPGTIPAAAVAPLAGYDSTNSDVYQALQPTLEQILSAEQTRQTSGSGITSAPAPIASTLFAPTNSGNYVFLKNANTIGEVESDGSIYGIGGGEAYSGPTNPAVLSQLAAAPAGGYFTKSDNLTRAASSFTPKS